MRSFQLRGLCAAIVLGAFGAMAAAPATAAETSSRMIVKFKAGTLAQGKAEIAKQRGKVLVDLSEVDALSVRLSPAALIALRKSPNVEFIEVDHPQYPMGRARAKSVTLAETVPYGIPMVQADLVSDASAGSRKLCIIDSGIDGTHPDLQGLPIAGENFTTSGTWDSDESAHGTHVAGTIAAVGGNGLGVVGVAPNRQLNLYIAKVFDASGSTSSSTVAKAMLACARNGANVVSMSLGGPGRNILQSLVARILASRNVMMIASAGNAGDTSTSYPAGLPEVISVAAIDSAMAHAAFSQSNADVEISAPGVAVLSTVPAFSETGSTVDVGGVAYASNAMDGSPRTSAAGALADFGLGDTPVAGSMAGKVCLISRGVISFADKVLNCQASDGIGAVIYNNAPGDLLGTMGGIATAIPSVGVTQADGTAMLAQLGQAASVAVFGLPDQYAFYNGTSMSAPHASAVAALVWSLHTNCTAAEMRISLNNSAMDLGAGGRDNDFGYGLIQAKTAHDRITSLGCGV